MPSVMLLDAAQKGNRCFLSTGDDDHHHRELVNKAAIATVQYSTYQHPVELNRDVDLEYALENEVRTSPPLMDGTDNRTKAKHSPTSPWGTNPLAAWWIFAPGGASPMQRVNSLDCTVVIEGVFGMILDSGEERTIQRGDIAI